MSSAQFLVSKSLQELVAHHLKLAHSRNYNNKSDIEKDQLIQKHIKYYLRILGARINGPQLGEGDNGSQSDQIKQLILKKISAQAEQENKYKIMGDPNARAHNQFLLNEQAERFETLNQKFQKNKIIGKKNQVLRFLLEVAGSGDQFTSNNQKKGSTFQQENITRALTSSLMQSAAFADYSGAVKDQREQKVQAMKNQMEQDMQQSQGGQKTMPNLQTKNLQYLKQIKFNGFQSTQSQDKNKMPTILNGILRSGQNQPDEKVSEQDIVRDLLFVFQGIEGRLIQYSFAEDAYILQPSLLVSPSTRKIINELCELGWLYKKVNDWLKLNVETSLSMDVNQVTQALCFSIQSELNEYFRLLSILDSQRQKYTEADTANFLNLRKLYLWVQEPLDRMKWLAIIIDSIQNLKGGAICSAINTFTMNGSPSTQQFINRILKEVSAPILSMIKTWMIEGEINDPFREFFVDTDPSVPDEKLWTQKYSLNPIMIPSFLSNELAQKILQTGKAVNFIRRCCREQDWLLDISLQLPFDAKNLEGTTVDTYTKLNKWVNHAYQVTNQSLVKILFDKFKLEGHCFSIRKYLLMGQGDFMQYLMDLLAEELGEPASKIYRHTLMGYLETAIRSSNAQYHDTEFLHRLDIKLLEASPGDRGWEIFQLDYRVDDLPVLNTIFTDEVMIVFQKINNFLWKLKRVEHGLSTSWGIGIANSNKFAKLPGMKNRFHRFYLAHQEMAHFVNNIHNYIMVEVLESAWKIYYDELKTCTNLDDIIRVQIRYSKSILNKALLSEEQRDLNRLLKKLLNNVYTFALIKERYFFKSAIDEFDRMERVRMHEEDDSGAMEELDQNDLVSQINHQSIDQLIKMHEEFYRNFQLFKENLENREETNFKYLCCRLDFNMYYQMKNYQQQFGDQDDDDDDEDIDDNEEVQGDDQQPGDYGEEPYDDEDDNEDIGVHGDDDDGDDGQI